MQNARVLGEPVGAARGNIDIGVGKAVPSTFIFNHILCVDILILYTYSPIMSLIVPHTSSSERISQGTVVSGESQRQRYASLSHLCVYAL